MNNTHLPQPERLSSQTTTWVRSLVPPLVTVVLGVLAVGVSLGWTDLAIPSWGRGAALAAWLGASYVVFKGLGSLRHVWLDGDDLLVDDGERKVRIPLADVADIRQSRLSRTKTITLDLKRPTPLGNKVRFVPHFALVANFMDHPVARQLRERRARLLQSGQAP